MTTAPPEDQVRLLDVQALDTRLDQLAHKRRAHPTLARLAELDHQVADLETALVTSRTAAGDLRRELTKAEQDVEQVRSRAARDQSRLDSGQGSAKDLQAITSELAALARRQGALEEVELEVMERLEAHESALGELTTAHEALVGQRTEVENERDAAFAEIDGDAARAADERSSAVAGIDPGLVTLYERLRSHSGGSGAARLSGRRCEGCRLELNPVDLDKIASAAPDQVVRCEECGRILVRIADAAPVA